MFTLGLQTNQMISRYFFFDRGGKKTGFVVAGLELNGHFQGATVASRTLHLGPDGRPCPHRLVFLVFFALFLAGRIGDFDILQLGLGGNADDRLHAAQVFIADRIGVDVPGESMSRVIVTVCLPSASGFSAVASTLTTLSDFCPCARPVLLKRWARSVKATMPTTQCLHFRFIFGSS